MKRTLRAACAAGILLAGLAQARATVITSEFTSGSEGWTASGGNILTPVSGGNPDGYLRVTDSGSSVMTVFAPGAFLGDLSVANGGTIGFDAQLFRSTGVLQPQFGTVSISNGSTTATLDLATGGPFASIWTTYTATLDAASWGLSSAAWSALLANVTSISLVLESTFGQGEIVGMDNFFISYEQSNVVPEPNTLVLSMIGVWGVAGLGYIRRRRQSVA